MFISVGLPHNPDTAGYGGFTLGCPLLPSIDSNSAVSSPHTNAPAPSLISISNSNFVSKMFLPNIPYSFAWSIAIWNLLTAIGYSAIRMASISKDIQIITIERDQERYQKAIENIKKAKCS